MSVGLPIISLESAERPNYFLSVGAGRRLQLEHWSSGEDFLQRATFVHHQGLWLPGLSSFELYSQKGFFVTLTRAAVRAKGYDHSRAFKRVSSFTIQGTRHTAPPTPRPARGVEALPLKHFFESQIQVDQRRAGQW